MRRRVTTVLVLGLLGAFAATAAAQEEGPDVPERGGKPYGMPYPLAGEPAPDQIFHVPTGLTITFDQMMDLVSAARIVYVGEAHDNVHAHRVQLAVIRELERRFPGGIAIGMEMFRDPQQAALDRWTRGELEEKAFRAEARWAENWGNDFGYYRDILAFARERRIDIVALNPAKDLEVQVNRSGLDALPPELKAKVPEMGEPDPFQRAMLEGIFGGHTATRGVIESFVRTQTFWEETMASRIVDYLRGPRGQGKRMVVLSGGWHVLYGFGIPKKVLRRAALPYAIVMPEEIAIPEDRPEKVMQVSLPEIPLLPADILWLVPYEDVERGRVRLGVQIEDAEGGVLVKGVVEGSPAEKAAVSAGSLIVSFDGKPLASGEDLVDLVREKRAGDRATLLLRREGVERTVEVEFFPLPTPKPPAPAPHTGAPPEAQPPRK